MARMREVCGTVNGMFLAAGLILGSDDTADRAAKSELYRRLQGLAERFRARNGSIVCRELLAGIQTTPGGVPEARTDTYYKKRPCAELCADAAEILEEFLRAYPKARKDMTVFPAALAFCGHAWYDYYGKIREGTVLNRRFLS